MAYDEKLAARVRQALTRRPVEEKKMMGGLTFMVNGKMCVGIIKDELMVRLDPAMHEEILERKGCHEMDMMKRKIRGFVLVSPNGLKQQKDFEYWIKLALDFNKRAKASKKQP